MSFIDIIALRTRNDFEIALNWLLIERRSINEEETKKYAFSQPYFVLANCKKKIAGITDHRMDDNEILAKTRF